MRSFIAAVLLILLAAPAAAQNLRAAAPGAAPPAATIEDVAWLAGHWVGEGLGGVSIETISPPVARQMAGHFQQIKDGKVQFYEIYQIVEHEGSLLLRLKHFNADLTGWEEKDATVDFPLVALEKDAAYFNGLTFRRRGEDGLDSFVLIGSGAGAPREAAFRFTREGR